MTESQNALRLYPAPWKGEAVFACRKCQRRMKKNGGPAALRKLKKWFKKRMHAERRTRHRCTSSTSRA